MRATIPNTFAAGETVDFEFDLTAEGYPASDGGELTLFLYGPALPADSTLRDGVAASADGDVFVGAISAELTGDLVRGDYTWVAQRAKDGGVKNVATGIVTVTPNPASTAAGDGAFQSDDEVQLAKVQATLTRLYGKDTKQLSAFELTIVRQEIKELEASRALLERRKAAARAGAEDTGVPQSGAFAFGRPS